MIVYLAGPINGCTDDEAMNWREYAKAQLVHETLDPMARDYRGQEDSNVVAIVEGDLADIAQCSAVLVNAARPSWGTAMEVRAAREMGQYVVAVVPSGTVSPWLRYHADLVAASLDEAIAHLNALPA